MGLAANISTLIDATLDGTVDIGSVSHKLQFNPSFVWTDGTAANQANKLFADTRTISASSNDDLDLSGVLTDAFGATLSLTKVKALLIRASTSNTNDVLVGGATSNPWFSSFVSSDDKIKVKPGGVLLLVAPNTDAYSVTAATGDILRIANGGAGTSVTYDIVLLGSA